MKEERDVRMPLRETQEGLSVINQRFWLRPIFMAYEIKSCQIKLLELDSLTQIKLIELASNEIWEVLLESTALL
jgi:hypothetical protein